jgi:hypothetical protein
MMMRVFFILSLVSCAIACGSDPESVAQSSSALVTENRLSSNKLSANRLAANRLSSNRLSSNRLAANKIAVNQLDPGGADLVATADGRELLSYIISCALPENESVVATVDGTTYEFAGALDLAPEWLRQPLDRRGQRWVSACLLARVNATGISVRISLRGPHRALTTTDGERTKFVLEEGAFFGNVFGPADQPLDWNACRGRDQAAGERGDLANRHCADPDPGHPGFTFCGFRYAGDCGDFARHPACRVFDADETYYEWCSAAAPPDGPIHREVVTTFVRE